MGHEMFERQMLWIKQHADVVSLSEIQERMASGKNDRLAVSVTFDDGYAENCDRAVPFLLEQQIPFTYFVSLDFVERQRPFPHDVAAGVPLPPNTPQQLREMASAGVEIGAHTRHHPDVGQIKSPATMIDEVVTSRNELAQLIGREVNYFAFPFGKPENLSAAAVELARHHGVNGICSAYGAYNLPGEDPFHIQRIHGDPEFIRFKNWLTLDFKKMGIGRDFSIPESHVRWEELKAQLTATIPPVQMPVVVPGSHSTH